MCVGRVVVTVIGRRIECDDHREPAARAELRALHAVREHFFLHPQVRDDREPEASEVLRSVRQDAQLLVVGVLGTAAEHRDQLRANALMACAFVHGQGADLGEPRAKRRELGAADNFAAVNRDDEPGHVGGDLIERP